MGPSEGSSSPIGSVLVVGAGVAGISAALDLAEAGYRVLLTDSSPAIGGILSKLDYQFPNDHCGMCKMLPMVGREYASQYCMRKSLFHDNIKIMPFTEVLAVEGEAGRYEVKLLKRARHVDVEVCIGTGYCMEVCPITAPDEFNQGLTTRKAIYQPVPHNLPNMYVIDGNICDRCGKCVEVCPVDAIKLDVEDEELTVSVDSLIFAAGSELYDPALAEGLGVYTVSPDVVTSLEFERLLSGSGGYDGQLRRLSDQRPAKRIAWLQCVGSRNRKEGRDFCSSICCMFALKEAVLAHEKGGQQVESTIFYMDMRTFGKDFYRYREYAEEKHGVRLIRCRVHHLDLAQDGSLEIRFLDPKDGQWKREAFDMVVLSTGQAPHKESHKFAQILGAEPSQMGFFPIQGFEKVKSPREGIYLCGSIHGLTDISEALTSGGAAASEASKLLSSLGKTPKEDPILAEERPVEREIPRICALICRWNDGKMPKNVDLTALKHQLSNGGGAAEVHIIDTLCRGEGYEEAGRILQETKCNRVLIGACLPYVYRQRLKVLTRKAGFNPALVEVVDMRSLIQRYREDRDQGPFMSKLICMLEMGMERLKVSDPLQTKSIPMVQKALVVGSGIAGMRAALSLASRRIEVHLVEREEELGGRPLRKIHYTLDHLDPRKLVQEMIQRVWENKYIHVYRKGEILSSNGSLGRFRTVIRNGDNAEVVLDHGATIIATGGAEATTSEYGYGQSEHILTQSEMEDRLATGRMGAADLGNVVMIQCVGSRERGGHEYCSRVCCAAALKNAFQIREQNPDARILILYRDMMTYGFLEQYYTQARGEGILFATYDLQAKPEVQVEEGRPVIVYEDQILGQAVKVTADTLVLSTGIVAEGSNAHLARILGVELNADGFFQEADSKWRPVDCLKEGIFLAGTAHSPRPIVEVIAQAEAAAQRASVYLTKSQITTARIVSRIKDAICARCQTCIQVCPYEARSFDSDNNRIAIDEAACQGCGICAVACPNSATLVQGASEQQTMAMIDAALKGVWL